ncbi:DNA-directed RNA polymerase I subunit RPA34 [Emys orbicularis]|uniref:DNA-directed RNA polymerase I subunit RPA34 n=1 Tax=Emys orbicularis TaxID=82168 RepID=UPI0031FC68A2
MERTALGGLPRFQCPPDFSPSPFAPEELRGPSKELWLIRAPADFSPDSLDGCAVPLVGFQTLKTRSDGTQRVFDIHSALEEPGSPYLLVSSTRSGQLSCAASFHGCMRICERFGDPSSRSPGQAVAARPAPQVPEGLRQRFLPFGGSPKQQCPEAATSTPATEVLGSARKKKKKKKKRVKEEPVELLVSIKQEPPEEPWGWGSGEPGPEPPGGEDDGLRGAEGPTLGHLSPKHKKKKKKKHKYEALEGAVWPCKAELPDPSSIKQEPTHSQE